jgi:hypothetical protein
MSRRRAARHRCTPYPAAAAAADAFADDNGETVVAMHEGQRALASAKWTIMIHNMIRTKIAMGINLNMGNNR